MVVSTCMCVCAIVHVCSEVFASAALDRQTLGFRKVYCGLSNIRVDIHSEWPAVAFGQYCQSRNDRWFGHLYEYIRFYFARMSVWWFNKERNVDNSIITFSPWALVKILRSSLKWSIHTFVMFTMRVLLCLCVCVYWCTYALDILYLF